MVLGYYLTEELVRINKEQKQETTKRNQLRFRIKHKERLQKLEEEYREKNREKLRVKALKQYYKNPSKQALKSKTKRDKIRDDLLAFLGGECVSCGFRDKRALQLDHINGNGYKDKKFFSDMYVGYKYYLLNPVLANQNLQVLCANCNWIKKHENKEHCGKYV